jgi:hypothetical protein
MGARTRSLLPPAVIGAIAAFRAEAVPFAAAAVIAGGVLLVALLAGARNEGAARETPARGTAARLLLIAGATAFAGLSDRLWPCDVACRGQEEWATLFRVPTLAWCGGATLLAALVLAIARAPDACVRKAAASELLAFGCAGASLWFVAVALERGVACRHCFAVHLPIFAAAALVWRGAVRPAWLRAVPLLVGALLTRQLFAIDLARSGAPTNEATRAATTGSGGPVVDATADGELAAAIDRGRTQGGAAPKLRVELHVSFNCGHCAEEFEPLQDALRPWCDDGEAELVVRLVAVKKEPASRELSKLALAAARDGRFRERVVATWAVRKAAVVDPKQRAPGGMQEVVNRYLERDALTLSKLKEQPAVAADATFIAAHAALFDRLVAADEALITRYGGSGELPWLFLVDPTSGAVLEKLPEGTTPASLATAVAARLR